MEQHALTQGSPEWLAYRATHRNASDAPAMMGVSPYKTRNQLLHETCTGMAAEVDARTQARFDDGHRFEALARGRAEDLVGEALYPVVGSIGNLSASFDGLTICDDIVWEHKTLNDEIRAAASAADLGLHYQIQMEQQLLVSGAGKALFLASKWDAAGDLLEERYFWYEPNLTLRADIVAGWAQFEIDLAAYVPPALPAKAEADAIMALPALVANIRGEVTLTNLPTFKEQADRFIASIKTDLQNDQDFADAELTIKFCDAAEKDIERAKSAAIAQTASIDDLMRTVDLIKDQLRAKRLMLAGLVDKRKKEIKETILSEAKLAYAEHIAAIEREIKPLRLTHSQPDFAGAMKNKRTLASLHDAVDTLLASAKIATNATAADYRAKQAWCREHTAEFQFLVMDLQSIIGKAEDDFRLLINSRIAEHKHAEAAKEEAARAKIREEERVKAEAAAETARLARVEADRAAAPSDVPAGAAPEIARTAEFYGDARSAAPARANQVRASAPYQCAASASLPDSLLDAIDDVGPSDEEIIEFGRRHDMELDELIPRLERFIADQRAAVLAAA